MNLRKYWATAAISATGFIGESPFFLFNYLLGFAWVAILLTLWRAVLAGRGEVSGMTLGAVLTYTLLAQALGNQLNPRAGIEVSMWNGTFVNHFTHPMPIVGQFVAHMFGEWSITFICFTVPLLLCAPLLGVDLSPASRGHALLFGASLVLGISVGLAIDFFFGALAAILDSNVWLVENLRSAATSLLSGAVLPLALLPWGLGGVFNWLPFAAVASAPLRIYTGTGEPLLLLASQAIWAVILWPLVGWLWHAHRERLTGFGGGG
jgi:ABC-type uncharacterized transport system permease subunit